MRMFLCFVLLLFSLQSAMAQEEISYNLRQAVDKALRDNPSMQAIRRELLAAEMGQKSARGTLLPSATAQYGYTLYDHDQPTRSNPTSRKDVWTAGLNIYQELFVGWRNLSTLERAVLVKENTQAKLQNTELTLIAAVQENFLALLKAREDFVSAKASLTRLQDQLKVTEAFYKVGLKPKLDVLQAEVDLGSAKTALLAAENQVVTQKARLNTLLNIPIDKAVNYTGDLNYQPFSMSMDDAINTAAVNRPDIIMAKKSVDIAVKDKSIVDSGFYPQVSAEFNWYTSGNRPSVDGSNLEHTEFSSWNAGVMASWKFWEWGKTYYASKEADARIAGLMQNALETRQEALFQIKANHLDIARAAATIGVTKKAVETAMEGYRMATARYQAKVGTNTEVLDAQDRLSSAEALYIAALADYKVALSKFYTSIGKKNPALLPE